jgi:ABC-type Fe3+/spermidine/putrescine transport system ATPase subunit
MTTPAAVCAPRLELRSVSIAYGATPAVHAVNLSVGPAETVALLGPSGAGKSSLLAAVAGFLRPWAGEIRIDGRVVVGDRVSLPPERRSVGVAFQNAALWPHLTVVQTVAYPYRRRGLDDAEARRRAAILLKQLGIERLADRRPAELSGGEQQRTGLARALARDAAVYLLDEPTAHLDAALKGSLQREMAELCRRDGAAVLYATHDVAEALALADRVAIIRAGRLVQVGTPVEVYERPADAWAASLTGPASVLSAADRDQLVPDGPRHLLVRPEWASLGGTQPGYVLATWFRGGHTDVDLETPYGTLTIREPGTTEAAPGARVTWCLRRAWLLPTESDSSTLPGHLSDR